MVGRARPGEPVKAVLLRSVDYGDADRVLTLMTFERGRISAMAKGAQRNPKRFGSALSPFVVIAAEMSFSNRGLHKLRRAELHRAFPGVLASLDRMMLAGKLCDLTRKLAPEGKAEPEIFEALVQLFATLERWEGSVADCERAFSLRLLELAGVGPQVSHCGECERSVPEGRSVTFQPFVGSVVCQACGGGPLLLRASALGHIQHCASSKWWERAEWTEADAYTVDRLLRRVLSLHLGVEDSPTHESSG